MSTYSCDQCDPRALQQYLNNETPCKHCGSDLTEITPSLPGDFEIHTNTICDGWVNCWRIGDGNTDEPQSFDTVLEAQAEIDEHITDLAQTRRDEGEAFDGVDAQHERSQLRIYQISTGTYVDDGTPADEEELDEIAYFEEFGALKTRTPTPDEPPIKLLLKNKLPLTGKPEHDPFQGPVVIRGLTLVDLSYGLTIAHFMSEADADCAFAITGGKRLETTAVELMTELGAVHTNIGTFQRFEIADDPDYLQPPPNEPTQQVLFIHGRDDPDEKLNDWGFDGTTIKGVSALHATYGNFVVHFASMEATIAAQALTGWDWFDSNALEMRWHENLVHTKEGYFADFEMQPETPDTKPDSTIRRKEEK